MQRHIAVHSAEAIDRNVHAHGCESHVACAIKRCAQNATQRETAKAVYQRRACQCSGRALALFKDKRAGDPGKTDEGPTCTIAQIGIFSLNRPDVARAGLIQRDLERPAKDRATKVELAVDRQLHHRPDQIKGQGLDVGQLQLTRACGPVDHRGLRRVYCARRLIKRRVQLQGGGVQIGQFVARNAQSPQIGLGCDPGTVAIHLGRIDHSHVDFTDLDNRLSRRATSQQLGPDISPADDQLIHVDLAIIRKADGLVRHVFDEQITGQFQHAIQRCHGLTTHAGRASGHIDHVVGTRCGHCSR